MVLKLAGIFLGVTVIRGCAGKLKRALRWLSPYSGWVPLSFMDRAGQEGG